LLVWADGDSAISLADVSFEYSEISEASEERRLPEEAEWTRQLRISLPSGLMCILFEQREPS
jgi:hypothetical protein